MRQWLSLNPWLNHACLNRSHTRPRYQWILLEHSFLFKNLQNLLSHLCPQWSRPQKSAFFWSQKIVSSHNFHPTPLVAQSPNNCPRKLIQIPTQLKKSRTIWRKMLLKGGRKETTCQWLTISGRSSSTCTWCWGTTSRQLQPRPAWSTRTQSKSRRFFWLRAATTKSFTRTTSSSSRRINRNRLNNFAEKTNS